MQRITLALAPVWLAAALAAGATLPAGFTETPVTRPVEPNGHGVRAGWAHLRLASRAASSASSRTASLLSTPFVSLTVDSNGERGLLGAAFDPNFATNQYVYVYYTVPGSPGPQPGQPLHGERRRRGGGSEVVILDLTNLSTATNHNGGALHFGPDGKLYISAGENANGANAQTLTNLLGKILRINPDGTIPTDNPFYATATGTNRAIWALGLRNPYTFDFQAGTGRLLHQRRGGEHLGGDRRRHRGLELRMAHDGRAHVEPELPRPDLLVPALLGHAHGLRHHRRGLLQPALGPVPRGLRREVFLRRLLRRLDLPPGPRGRDGHPVQDGHQRAGGRGRGPRRKPLLPGARHGTVYRVRTRAATRR